VNAFVTGATGFAGGHLCRMLVERGHRVVALARPTSDTSTLRRLAVEIVEGDVRDKASFAAALRGADTVFHLAGVFREVRLSEQQYREVNVGGTGNVIEAAAEAAVRRFVHCSTVGVIGETGPTPAAEDRPYCDARDSYNRTKIEAEKLALKLFGEHGLGGVIARPSSGYGPGELRYAKLFRSIKRGRFVMIGSGRVLYNLAYIDDLCEGLFLCGTAPQAAGQTFLLAGRENVPLNDVVRRIAATVGRRRAARFRVPLGPVMLSALLCERVCRPLGVEPPLHRRRVEFFSLNRAYDISKACSELGYSPRVPLEEGLRRMAEWYESRGLI